MSSWDREAQVKKYEALFNNCKDEQELIDIAKNLLDKGYHAPTIYFPLIVPEALMIEPTETENKQSIDGFIQALKEIYELAEENPSALHEAPKNCPVSRIDEVSAAREPNLRW